MASRNYWNGFAAGAVAGAAMSMGALLFTNLRGRAGKSRIIRLEKSVQVGRPVEEVFEAWRRIEHLPQLSHLIEEVRREGNRSHWRVRVNGRKLAWDAEIEKLIPNQSIGWKSVRGVKHSGRISFSPIGSDTLLHVTMNYAPSSRLLRPFLAPMSGDIEGYIEAVLRDFKRAVESGEVSKSGPRAFPGGTITEPRGATGTFGPTPSERTQSEPSPYSGPEFTAPPEARG
jgi:uncharacterized membrane protein